VKPAVRVKICGLTRSRDVRAAVSLGADAIGLVFARGSKRLVDADNARKLVKSVPAFVTRVGLFLDQDAGFVESILGRVSLSLLQFHGDEEADFCRRFGLPYIKAVSMQSAQALADAQLAYPDAAGLLLDSHETGGLGGTGTVFDWNHIRQGYLVEGRLPLVLAGGLTVGNVRQAVQQVKPWAVDVSSGVEDEPGIKNAVAMQKFIEEAKSE